MNNDHDAVDAFRRLDRPIAPDPEIDARVRQRILDQLAAPSEVESVAPDLEVDFSPAGPGHARRRWIGAVSIAAAIVIAVLVVRIDDDKPPVATSPIDHATAEADPVSAFCAVEYAEYLTAYTAFRGSGLDPALSDRNGGLQEAQETFVDQLDVLGALPATDIARLRDGVAESGRLLAEDAIDVIVVDALGRTQDLIQQSVESFGASSGCDPSDLSWEPGG